MFVQRSIRYTPLVCAVFEEMIVGGSLPSFEENKRALMNILQVSERVQLRGHMTGRTLL